MTLPPSRPTPEKKISKIEQFGITEKIKIKFERVIKQLNIAKSFFDLETYSGFDDCELMLHRTVMIKLDEILQERDMQINAAKDAIRKDELNYNESINAGISAAQQLISSGLVVGALAGVLFNFISCVNTHTYKFKWSIFFFWVTIVTFAFIIYGYFDGFGQRRNKKGNN